MSAPASSLSRRRFCKYAAALGVSTYLDSLLPAYAREVAGLPLDVRAPGDPIDVFVRRTEFKVGDRIYIPGGAPVDAEKR